MSTRDPVQASLRALCQQLIDRPFCILREAGLQAELRSLLIEQSSLNEHVPILIGEHKPPKRGPRFGSPRAINDQLLRVQLEMKIYGQRDAPDDADDRSPARVDVVVLKSAADEPRLSDRGARLTCYPNGPGDVVATIDPEDVAAAIEIKASPSADPGQCDLYKKDILRLLDLVGRFPELDAFFLTVDKSQALFGSGKAKPITKPVNWNDPKDVAGKLDFDTRVRIQREVPEKGGYVEIWSVWRKDGPDVLYAVPNQN